MCYWRETISGEFHADKFPTFLQIQNNGMLTYGLPVEEYPGLVKVSIVGHGGLVDIIMVY